MLRFAFSSMRGNNFINYRFVYFGLLYLIEKFKPVWKNS